MSNRLIRSLALLAAGAALSGCVSGPPAEAPTQARLPTEQFQAKVLAEPLEIRLAVHEAGLSANQSQALASFADDWRAQEAGLIRLHVPAAGHDKAALDRMVKGARAQLAAQGVPSEAVEVVAYDGGPAGAPVRLSFVSHTAVIPQCGRNWASMTHTASNQAPSNFGCAVTANAAAQIANPADLLQPRGLDPADPARRSDVLGKYQRGERTGATTDDRSDGAVSRAID